MPNYTADEQRNIDATHRLFDTSNPEDKSMLFSEDAAWWNGLPYVGATPGETEHKGRAAINAILTGATGGPPKTGKSGTDAYDVSTIRNEDIVLLADGDFVVRQHTMYAKTHRGQDYTNVYCFVFKFNEKGEIIYLTEHWNTWHAYNVLFNNFEMAPAHPNG